MSSTQQQDQPKIVLETPNPPQVAPESERRNLEMVPTPLEYESTYHSLDIICSDLHGIMLSIAWTIRGAGVDNAEAYGSAWRDAERNSMFGRTMLDRVVEINRQLKALKVQTLVLGEMANRSPIDPEFRASMVRIMEGGFAVAHE